MTNKKSIVILGIIMIALVATAYIYNQPRDLRRSERIQLQTHVDFPELDLEFLTQEADYIAIGVIADQGESYVKPDESGIDTVYTDCFLKVSNMLKAPTQQLMGRKEIVIREVDREESPRFKREEKVLVFLHQGPDATATIAGWQGKYTLINGKAISRDEQRNMSNGI